MHNVRNGRGRHRRHDANAELDAVTSAGAAEVRNLAFANTLLGSTTRGPGI
jgi:hypothetical protein